MKEPAKTGKNSSQYYTLPHACAVDRSGNHYRLSEKNVLNVHIHKLFSSDPWGVQTYLVSKLARSSKRAAGGLLTYGFLEQVCKWVCCSLDKHPTYAKSSLRHRLWTHLASENLCTLHPLAVPDYEHLAGLVRPQVSPQP